MSAAAAAAAAILPRDDDRAHVCLLRRWKNKVEWPSCGLEAVVAYYWYRYIAARLLAAAALRDFDGFPQQQRIGGGGPKQAGNNK